MPQLKPIKTGICSYGMSGRIFHAPFINCMELFEFSAITERHARNAEKRYPKVKTYTSVEDMLGDEALELIVVNTPNLTHFEYASKALKQGKHVIIEKPFAATLTECLELVELAQKHDKLLVVFQNRRWDSDFQSVQNVVNKERLGKLIDAEFRYDRYRLGLSGKQHKEKPATGVGLIYDLGPHLIDQALVLFGRPQKVFARIQMHRPHSEVDDYFTIHLIYDGFNCILKASQLVREPTPAYVLHGTKGSYIKSRGDVQESDLDQGLSPCRSDWGIEPEAEKGLLHTEVNDQAVRENVDSPRGDYKLFYKKAYACIRENKPTPVELDDSLLNMRIIEAAVRSQENDTVVMI